jgi:hypothetical protein
MVRIGVPSTFRSLHDSGSMSGRATRCLTGTLVAASLVAVVLAAVPVAKGLVSAEEREIQAAYLYRFLFFVEWPEEAFANEEAPLVVGVLGRDPFGAALIPMTQREVQGRKIEVRRLGSAAEARRCHLLFVSTSEDQRLPGILESLSGLPVLTVGESSNFDRAGGMIRFTMRRDRVRFRVNAGPVARAGLRLSSQLLKVAEKVRP